MISSIFIVVAMLFFGYAAGTYRERFVACGMPLDLFVGIVGMVLAFGLYELSFTTVANIFGMCSVAGFASYVHMLAITASSIHLQQRQAAEQARKRATDLIGKDPPQDAS